MTDTLDSIYSRIRAEEKEALATRIAEAYLLAPELKELDKEKTKLFQAVGSRKLSAQEGKERLTQISKQERSILLSIGFSVNALTLQERCELCHDTGFIGELKQPCACRLLYRELLRGSEGINDRETFANFSCDIFHNPEQKKRTLNAKKICETFAHELPKPSRPNLLIMGLPGLGKSFLGNAIAREAIQSGVDSIYLSAYALTQQILSDIREHTENISRLQTVPLLVLDDLGCEPVIPNISTEWFFAIINERVIAGRATVCITNLTLKELQARYSERLVSRLYDLNTTQVLMLTGDNLRTI